MASETRSTKPGEDGDGVRISAVPGVRRGTWLLLAAVAMLALLMLALLRARRSSEDRLVTRAPQGAGAPAEPLRGGGVKAVKEVGSQPVRLQRIKPAVEPIAAEAKRPAAAEPPPLPADEPANTAANQELEGDQPTGIALFPPPGTDPPKSGIIVPDDFELPPGYLRHYQVTDDGISLSPILMFHPDFQLVDERGEAVAMPADRVVPSEMAPPGLPIRMLEVPDSTVPGVGVQEGPGRQDSQP